MESKRKKFFAFIVVLILVGTLSINFTTKSIVFNSFIMHANAGSNENSSWHNSTYLNVTIESKRPRINWYDFQKCENTSFDGRSDIDSQPWGSRRNALTETDNSTWYRFIINISSDQGWDNIEYINVSSWHDDGNDSDNNGLLTGTGGYNRSGNEGGNRNFFLVYDNTSNVTANYTLIYPSNNTEITIGNYSENNVSDPLGISGQTETHNISFVFKPGYQFRYAQGPGESQSWTNDTVTNTNGMPDGTGYNATTSCWESFDNKWSWNFNITAENGGENWKGSQDTDSIDRYKSWVNDEFGIYSYTEIVSATNAEIFGAPGERHSTNGSSWYNANFNSGNSANITVRTRSNGNYTLSVNVSDLKHIAYATGSVPYDPLLMLDNKTIYVRGGNRSTSINFSDGGQSVIYLYGFGSGDGLLSGITNWQSHEVNGTSKYTGESGDDGMSELYPNNYDSSTFNSKNSASHYIEFACAIPAGQIAGKYTTHVYYHLRSQTHD
jgi:hypothetical protein